jgi:hypothetical protein
MKGLKLRSLLTKIDRKLWTGTIYNPPPMIITNLATRATIKTVDELVPLCKQAMCGVNDKTVTDLTVRKTLRVGRDRVSFEWAALPKVVEDCAFGLGLGDGVEAQLHDVLVYRPGDFFKPHIDSIKHPRHCATLVVDTGLPGDACSGGVLYVGDERWVPASVGSYAAWFTNAQHHVTTVTNGVRVVATFILLSGDKNDQPVRKNAAAMLKVVEHLQLNASRYLERFSATDANNAIDAFCAPRVMEGGPTQREEDDFVAPAENGTDAKPLPSVTDETSSDDESGEEEEDEEEEEEDRSEKEVEKALRSLPKTYVGLWPLRQYNANMFNSKFCKGADDVLAHAIEEAFGVPPADIQWHEAITYPYCGVIGDNCWKEPGRERKLLRGEQRALRIRNHDYEEFDIVYGCNVWKVIMVDGTDAKYEWKIGYHAGNDAGDPIYRYVSYYVRFPLKYLVNYVARANKCGETASAAAPPPVAAKRRREEVKQ